MTTASFRFLYVFGALQSLLGVLQVNLLLLQQWNHFSATRTRRMRSMLLSDSGPRRPQFKAHKKRQFWVRPGRTSVWWDNIVAGIAVEEEWKENFRMSRAPLVALAERLRPYIEGKE